VRCMAPSGVKSRRYLSYSSLAFQNIGLGPEFVTYSHIFIFIPDLSHLL
jgi:hypothetical protein